MQDLLKLEHLFYSEEYFPKEDEEIEETSTNICEHDFINMESHVVCQLCGIVDIDRPIFVADNVHKVKQTTNCVYHRKTYFTTVLKLMAGYKQCSLGVYPELIESLSSQNFETIFELKKLMRKLGFQKFYKYIYSIYYDIKKKRLIDLKLNDITFLTNKFIALESEFKKIFLHRSNLLSYSLVVYCLFKKYNYPFYDNLVVPKKKTILIGMITNLLNQ
jgi:hypothetical protein